MICSEFSFCSFYVFKEDFSPIFQRFLIQSKPSSSSSSVFWFSRSISKRIRRTIYQNSCLGEAHEIGLFNFGFVWEFTVTTQTLYVSMGDVRKSSFLCDVSMEASVQKITI